MSIVARNLAKRYAGGVWGARDVRFEARDGEITVLLGPNGAGKTTTIGMLATLLRPDKGEVIIGGISTSEDPWGIRKRIALCPQDVKVDMNWSPWDAVKGYLMTRGFSRNEAEESAERYLRILDLWNIKDRPSIQLSGGQRKRIAIAMVLAADVLVVFLDEPSSGLDVEGKYVVWKSLREEAKRGKTIILTTHDMREAEILGDKIVIISEGVSVLSGSPEELRGELPSTHKIVVKNAAKIGVGVDIDLGDRKIIYARSREEAIDVARGIVAEKVSIEETTLEDVYLHVMGGVGNGRN